MIPQRTSGQKHARAENNKGTWRILFALAVIYTALTVPLWADYLSSWDAGNYALALHGYDVLHDRPQPPGYVVYIGLAKLINGIIDDPNRAFILINWSAGLLAVMAVYGCLRRLRVPLPWLWSLCYMTIPLFWFFNVIAWMYAVHGCIYAVMLYVMLVNLQENRYRYLLPVLYAFAAGLRQDAVLFIAVPLLYTVLAGRRLTWRYALTAVVLFAVPYGLWYLPLRAVHYPWYETYNRIQVSNLLKVSSIFYGVDKIAANVAVISAAVRYGLLTTMPLFAVALVFGCRHIGTLPRKAGGLLVSMLPVPAIFYLLIHIGREGYLLALLPPLFVLAALLLSGLDRRKTMALLLLCLALNAGYFLRAKYPLTWRAVQREDKVMAEIVHYVRDNFSPEEVLVVSDLRYRQVVNYLPEYPVVWPVAIRSFGAGKYYDFIVRCREYHEDHRGRYFWDNYTDNVLHFDRARTVVLTDEGLAPRVFGEVALDRHGDILQFPVMPGQAMTFGPDMITLE